MEIVSNAVKIESIKSFQSTISKFEKAWVQMTEKGFMRRYYSSVSKPIMSAWLYLKTLGIKTHIHTVLESWQKPALFLPAYFLR